MALNVQEFLDKYNLRATHHSVKDIVFRQEALLEMKADLEWIVLNARTEGISAANDAFNKGKRLVSLKRRSA